MSHKFYMDNHFLISLLNPSRDYLLLISAAIDSQIVGPKYDADLVPQFRYKHYELDL